jgi:hypothetical protein
LIALVGGLASYVHLRALKLVNVQRDSFARLLNTISRRLQTLIVKLDEYRRLDSESESMESTWVVRALNTLPDLCVCHIDGFRRVKYKLVNVFESLEHITFERLFSLAINECMSLDFLGHVLERTPRLRRLHVKFVCPLNDQHKCVRHFS